MLKDGAKILLISREKEWQDRLLHIFNNHEFQITRESQIGRLLKRFESQTYDLVVLVSSACKNNPESCLQLLKDLTAMSSATQSLFLVEKEDLQMALSAFKENVSYYIKLPVGNEELRLVIESIFQRQPPFGTNHILKMEDLPDRLGQLIGRSMPMQHVYEQIRQAAATDIPVLLLGETGTGKDIAAQEIHKRSNRTDGPYIPVNLGAIPTELVASELFGHEKGAFTGAVQEHIGKFEQGNNGTVFLDEIDSVDEKVQVSLLRLIEQKKFHRLGGKKAISTNVRMIAASNENLEELVYRGIFRKDLFYRLDVFRIFMPPLRQRREDIPLLAHELLLQYNRALKKKIRSINPRAIELLENYNWPGNVRELKNVIQRAVLVCEDNHLGPDHLPSRFRSFKSGHTTVSFTLGTSLDDVEKEMVIRALSATNNNRKQAAEILGISRRALYNKLRKHAIK